VTGLRLVVGPVIITIDEGTARIAGVHDAAVAQHQHLTVTTTALRGDDA